MHTTSRPLSEKVLNIYFKMFDFELATTHLEGSEITDLITESKGSFFEVAKSLGSKSIRHRSESKVSVDVW